MYAPKKNIFLIAGVLLLSLSVMGCSALLEARELDRPSTVGQGEAFFVHGEILSLDGRNLQIEQHMDDSQSIDVDGRVTLAADVTVYANRADGDVPASRSDLQVGHMVGMNVGTDGLVHTVIFDDLQETGQAFFVHGEILSIDGRNLQIEQHMDDSQSIDVDGRVTLAANVTVYANRADGDVPASRSDLQVGHVVGMNVGTDGLVHTVIFDDLQTGQPSGPADPTTGEIFVYFEITGLDLDNRLIHIEQHMDSGSVEVDRQLRLAGDVEVFTSGDDGETAASLEDLQIGQAGGLILHGSGNLKGLVRKIIVDSLDEIAPSDPRKGEIFIYAEILRVDGRTLHIDQHMDSGSVEVGDQVTMAHNVIIRGSVDGHPVTPMEISELRPGAVVGMIQKADGLVRAIIVE